MNRLLVALALCVAVAASTAEAKRVKAGRPVQFAGAATVAQAATLVQATGNADFSGVRRVVIPYFQLEVQSRGGRQESSRAFMSNMRNNVSVVYKIEGVDGAGMQALADRLYADLVASFRARGIEVIDRADARARSAAYAKLEGAYQPGATERGTAGGGRSTFYAPTGMGLYFVGVENVDEGGVARGISGLGGIGGMLGGLGSMASGFSHMGEAMAETNAMTELDAAVVGVRLKVVFVETEGLRLNGFVQVSHRASIAVQPLDTQLWIMAPQSQMPRGANTRVQYQLASGIVPATDAITAVDDTQSTLSRVDTVVGNLIGGLSGTSSYSKEEYTVRLDPALFSATMGETMGAVQTMLVDRFRPAAAATPTP